MAAPRSHHRSPCAVPAWSACGRRCMLARRGHAVTLYERSAEPFAEACSPYAGAMLAPRCEEESAEPVIGELGKRGIALWRETYPGTVANGTLVVALHRDRAELDRFARMTAGHRAPVAGRSLPQLEPDSRRSLRRRALLSRRKRISRRTPRCAFLLDCGASGRAWRCASATARCREGADLVIDCRGLAAKDDLPTLARRARRADRGQEPRGASRRGPCGCCIRAFRSTSCPGATVFI